MRGRRCDGAQGAKAILSQEHKINPADHLAFCWDGGLLASIYFLLLFGLHRICLM